MSSAYKINKVCRFFQKGHCREGENCRFIHPLHPSKGPSIQPPTSDLQENSSKVDDGSSAVYSNSQSIKNVGQTRNRSDTQMKSQTVGYNGRGAIISNNPQKQKSPLSRDLREKELRQLQNRFRTSYKEIHSPSQSIPTSSKVTNTQTVIELSLNPTSSIPGMTASKLTLHISIPLSYPPGPNEPLDPSNTVFIDVINNDILENVLNRISQGINQRALRLPRLTIFQLLNWLDSNLARLISEDDQSSEKPAFTKNYVKDKVLATTKSKEENLIAPISSEPAVHAAETGESSNSEVENTVESTNSGGDMAKVSLRVPVRKPEKLSSTDSTTVRETEISQLSRRFRATFGELSTSKESSLYRFSLTPSDPDFPFDLDNLNIVLDVPNNYPTSSPSITIDNEEIPKHLRENVEKGWATRVRSSPRLGLLAMVNWLDRNLEILLTGKVMSTIKIVRNSNKPGDTGKENVPIENDSDAQLAVKPNDSHEAEFKSSDSNAADDSSDIDSDGDSESSVWDSTGSMSDSEDFSEISESEFDSLLGESRPTSSTPNDPSSSSTTSPSPSAATNSVVPKGTQIRLPDIQLDNIALLECSSLSLLVRCIRCKETTEIKGITPIDVNKTSAPTLQLKSQKYTPCNKCSVPLSVQFYPHILHPSSTTIGTLTLTNCSAFDLLPSSFTPTCANCVTPYPSGYKSLTRGQDIPLICKSCHSRMSIRMESIRFVKVGEVNVDLDEWSMGLKVKKRKLNEGIVPGQPLPRSGACKHYRRSYRWMRFPCCSRAFPCDVCHDEANPDKHETQRANRMICGYCSKEQPFTGDACKFCHADLTKKSTSGYWEGGKGTRDKSRMSRKEDRKYKNSKLKTQSKKSERVGIKKGKEKEKDK